MSERETRPPRGASAPGPNTAEPRAEWATPSGDDDPLALIAWLRRIIDACPDGIVVIDDASHFRDANPAACQIFGVPREVLLGQTWRDLGIAAEIGEPVEAQVLSVFERRQPVRAQMDFGEASFEYVVSPSTDAHGEVTFVIIWARDVTERRKAERARREEETRSRHLQKLESLGLLAGGIAHDFNDLLVGVLGNASLALLELPEGAPAREYLDSIRLAAQRAAGLARQLLAYAGRGEQSIESLGIVRGHGGGLRFESGPGLGTTATMVLPVGATVRAAPPEADEPVEWKGSGQILVVDDEDAVRAVLYRLLPFVGFEVLLAADGLEGMRVFAEEESTIVLVLLDLTMPKMGGLEVFEAIRARRPELPIVLTSGYDEEDVVSRLVAEPRTAFVHKPFTLETLRRTMRRVLEE